MSAATSATPKFCDQCGAALASGARFCSQCGKGVGASPRRQRAPITPKQLVIVGVLGLAIWGAAWEAQESLSGPRPTKAFDTGTQAPPPGHGVQSQEDVNYDDPEIVKLRDAAKSAKDNPDKWRALSQALLQRVRGYERPPSNLLFETIDTLREILKISPDDPGALIAMADISFDQQAFTKARELYEHYLKGTPNDHSARSRYASALTFLGEFDKAIAELNKVLKADPKNFNATAFLAITYAEMGKMDLAKSTGDKAVALAPSEEARTRFKEFLAKLSAPQQPDVDSANKRGNLPEDKADASSPGGDLPPDAAKIASRVTSSSVAGPKYAGAKMRSPDTLELTFNNFPMAQMPPFAKDKFFGALKEAAAGQKTVKHVVFVDSASGEELSKLDF